jgi:ferredoxin--NADP+ reductase
MTYVIIGTCVVDTACVDVCPVDCIHPSQYEREFDSAEQLYIDPEVCVQCNACLEACPIGAVMVDTALPANLLAYKQINADYSKARSR